MEEHSSIFISLAFDFGTTYSGYAFSFKSSPTDVNVNCNWYAGSGKLVSQKTSTSLLLDPDGKVHSFGFEAEDKYANLAEEGIHHAWRLFRRFKMFLYNDPGLASTSTVDDTEGRSYFAILLFTMAIRFLHQHALQLLNQRNIVVKETDIRYVITVPAIWGVPAKQFMRVAATDAGIDGERLKIALEPETASIWCERQGQRFTGNKFMLVDLGGGTADISVHEKRPDGRLRNIHAPSGGPWGGTCVDENYIKFLSEVFGKEALQDLKKTDMCDYLELMRDFEMKKRAFDFQSGHWIIFRIPVSLWNRAENQLGQTIDNRLRSLTYGSNVTATSGAKLKVHQSVVKAWLDEPVSKLLVHLEKILKEKHIEDIQHLVLVGGFGECRYVQQRIQSELKGMQLIVPEDAGLVVLKGAVVFGHSPEIIASRVMAFTYGVRRYQRFNPAKHRDEMKVFKQGEWLVPNLFKVFVRANEEIAIDDSVSYNCTPTGKVSRIVIYMTRDMKPKYTTDAGCKRVASLKLHNSEDIPYTEQKCVVSFLFADTELIVKAQNRVTGNVTILPLDLLDKRNSSDISVDGLSDTLEPDIVESTKL
ncbi:heat shock 70 kDa protein 12B-like isoform X1 [Dreissena polymorpha]|uniref:heat shock 70 kDa protein 12B-like isoform X1 n=1 Tax=Dreissena polymorpha TaxID=45954 RepID=UPI0022652F1B|nr:heat shock 70 kDa protein 12B-like isoform X1 [Dreissena polymorpha]